MTQRLLAALFALALAGPVCAQTEAPSAPPTLAADGANQETVLVVGQRPGPGLWKISKGEHVLWVFGTYGPLPTKMAWRSQQVESILAQSQEVIGSRSVSPKIGVFKMISLAPLAFGMTKNPDGATLKDVLPGDVYARWEAMRKQYLGDQDLERERPLFAADRLYNAGLLRAGLTTKHEVGDALWAMVKKSKLHVIAVKIEATLDDPGAALKMFKRSPLEDVACLTKTMDRLESDIAGMKERANAWSKGDLAAIRKLDFADSEGACRDVVMRSAAMKRAMNIDEIKAGMDVAWLAAAEQALARNASTFAVLSIKDLLDPKGVIASLQAKGYEVVVPD